MTTTPTVSDQQWPPTHDQPDVHHDEIDHRPAHPSLPQGPGGSASGASDSPLAGRSPGTTAGSEARAGHGTGARTTAAAARPGCPRAPWPRGSRHGDSAERSRTAEPDSGAGPGSWSAPRAGAGSRARARRAGSGSPGTAAAGAGSSAAARTTARAAPSARAPSRAGPGAGTGHVKGGGPKGGGPSSLPPRASPSPRACAPSRARTTHGQQPGKVRPSGRESARAAGRGRPRGHRFPSECAWPGTEPAGRGRCPKETGSECPR